MCSFGVVLFSEGQWEQLRLCLDNNGVLDDEGYFKAANNPVLQGVRQVIELPPSVALPSQLPSAYLAPILPPPPLSRSLARSLAFFMTDDGLEAER